MEIVLRVKNLIKKYSNKVIIDNLSLELERGKITFISAPSGSGKTTFFRIISSLDEQYEGEVEVLTKKIGYLSQDRSYFPWLTVKENILFSNKLSNFRLPINDDKYLELLSLAELKEFQYRYPKTLSGGQKQRMAICQKLMMDSDLLLLDEPFNSLDFNSKQKVFVFLKDIVERFGVTIIIASHSLDDISELADSVLIFNSSPIKRFTSISEKINFNGLKNYITKCISST